MGAILYIFLRLWQVTYSETGASELGGLSLPQMLWYLVMTEAIVLSEPRVTDDVDQDVRTGALAVQLIKQERTSTMVCLTDGNYDSVPIDTLLKSSKGVNVSGLYDANQYRANLMQVENMPMFLY